MYNSKIFRSLLGLMTTAVVACGLLPRAAPQPLPSPGPEWSITFKQTGGFVGVSLSLEVSSSGKLKAQNDRSGQSVEKDLPPETLAHIRELYAGVVVPTPGGPPSGGCADCYIYDVQLTSGGQVTQISADDTTLDSSGAADLIAYLTQLRDSALRAAP